MGWGLMRWIVSVRAVQLLGSFIPGALNGWLLYYIYSSKDLGLTQSMIILQILVCYLHRLLITALQLVFRPAKLASVVVNTSLSERHPMSNQYHRSLWSSFTHYCRSW